MKTYYTYFDKIIVLAIFYRNGFILFYIYVRLILLKRISSFIVFLNYFPWSGCTGFWKNIIWAQKIKMGFLIKSLKSSVFFSRIHKCIEYFHSYIFYDYFQRNLKQNKWNNLTWLTAFCSSSPVYLSYSFLGLFYMLLSIKLLIGKGLPARNITLLKIGLSRFFMDYQLLF